MGTARERRQLGTRLEEQDIFKFVASYLPKVLGGALAASDVRPPWSWTLAE
jgi:hypothetical protein